MHFKIKNDTLVIDEDDHYWTGIINQYDFPEEIRENYLDIIEKSFDNFIDEEYSVTRNFEDTSKYVINFHYKSKPFSFKRNIEIPMMLKNKDFKDYTNERIEKLEEEIKKLHEIFQTLQLSIQQKSKMFEDNGRGEKIECKICRSIFNADKKQLDYHAYSKHNKNSLTECFPTYNEMIEDDEENDDDSSVEVEIPIKTKGGKQVMSTVKLKNGRQSVSKN